jgi:nucleoside-triphosphatase THEP1
MLFFLTGNIQTGKTRWLQNLVLLLESKGVVCCGVMAPGIWKEENSVFEKLGIENELLPQHERIPFAMRRDLVAEDSSSQSAKAKLGWQIDDTAIDRVNEHLSDVSASAPKGSLLIVDELGQLELLRGGGLTGAIELLKRGETEQFPNAIIIVRDWLLDDAMELFGEKWSKSARIFPNDEAREQIFSAVYALLP